MVTATLDRPWIGMPSKRPVQTPFAIWLWEFMEARGLGQRGLVRESGISASLIGRWLEGVIPSRKNLQRFSDWSGVPLMELERIAHGDAASKQLTGMAAADADADAILARIDAASAELGRIRDLVLRRRPPPTPDAMSG